MTDNEAESRLKAMAKEYAESEGDDIDDSNILHVRTLLARAYNMGLANGVDGEADYANDSGVFG